MTTTRKRLEDIRVDIIKIISYDATNKFTYFYPRLNIQDEICELKINNIHCSSNLLIAAINHLIEVLVITYDEFMDKVSYYLNEGLKNQLFLKDLIFNIFYEEYINYLRPILQLSNSFLLVEAPYDKFYFVNHTRDIAYRIVPLQRIQSYPISKLDFEVLQIYTSNPQTEHITERIFTPLRQSVINEYK